MIDCILLIIFVFFADIFIIFCEKSREIYLTTTAGTRQLDEGADVVISAVGTRQLDEQTRIVMAIKEAGNVIKVSEIIILSSLLIERTMDAKSIAESLVHRGSCRLSSALTQSGFTPWIQRPHFTLVKSAFAV